MEEDKSSLVEVEPFNIAKALRVLVPVLPQTAQFIGHSSFPVKVGISRLFELTIYFHDQNLPKQSFKVTYLVNYSQAALQKVYEKSNVAGPAVIGFNQLAAGVREYLRF